MYIRLNQTDYAHIAYLLAYLILTYSHVTLAYIEYTLCAIT